MLFRFVFLLLLSQSVWATDHTEAWTMFLAQRNWGEQNLFGVAAFSTPRYSFKTDELYQNLVGVLFLYKLNSSYEMGMGYLHDVNQDFWLKEKRPFIDFSYRTHGEVGHLWIRNRLEYRIYHSSKVENLRYRIMGRYDFNTEWTSFQVHPFLSNELLIRLKDQNWANQLGFTQNRFFAGVRKSFTGGLKLDLAALVFLNQRSLIQDRFIYGPSMNVIYAW